MGRIPRPQDTGCTTIEVDKGEGYANGIISMIADFHYVEYDEERDAYVVE
jgi:hypothetical protein